MSEAKQPTVEQLTQQINDLSLLVKKQSQLLTKTGEQVLTLQVRAQRESDNEPKSLSGKVSQRRKQPTFDTTDFATNDDLVQLVGELQGQLEVIEERSIRRLVNSQKKEGDVLAPQLNSDGEEPPLELYPKDIEAFTKINDSDLVKLARFYEVLAPTQEEKAKFEDFVEGKSEKLDTEVAVDPSLYSQDDLNDAFDKL